MEQDNSSDLTGIRFVRVLNKSGEAIPPCAAVRVTGIDVDTDTTTVGKPDADGQTTGILFNGQAEIPANQETIVSIETPLLALCEPGATVPAAGETWGTVSGQWFLRKDKAGFQAVGTRLSTADGHYAEIVQKGGGGGSGSTGFCYFTLPSALALTDASIAACPVTTYWGIASPGSTITAWNMPASSNYVFSGATGNVGLATYDADNSKWRIVQMEC